MVTLSQGFCYGRGNYRKNAAGDVDIGGGTKKGDPVEWLSGNVLKKSCGAKIPQRGERLFPGGNPKESCRKKPGRKNPEGPASSRGRNSGEKTGRNTSGPSGSPKQLRAKKGESLMEASRSFRIQEDTKRISLKKIERRSWS